LLKRESKAKEYNQPVISATSEKRNSGNALKDVKHAYRNYEGKMIKKSS